MQFSDCNNQKCHLMIAKIRWEEKTIINSTWMAIKSNQIGTWRGKKYISWSSCAQTTFKVVSAIASQFNGNKNIPNAIKNTFSATYLIVQVIFWSTETVNKQSENKSNTFDCWYLGSSVGSPVELANVFRCSFVDFMRFRCKMSSLVQNNFWMGNKNVHTRVSAALTLEP